MKTIKLLNNKYYIIFEYYKNKKNWYISINKKDKPDYFGYHRFKYSLTNKGVKKTK
jgi:hypothetical protein